MILDIVLIAIIVLCAIGGFRKGFGYTFIHTAGWIIAVLVAFMATSTVRDYLNENTDFLEEFIPVIPAASQTPDILGDSVIAITSNMIFTIVVFLAIFIAVKLVLWIILALFTRSNKGGFVGVVDGVFGGALGIVKGCVLVLVIVLVMIPLADIFLPDFASALEGAVSGSYITEAIYNNNPLLLLLQSFLVEG